MPTTINTNNKIRMSYALVLGSFIIFLALFLTLTLIENKKRNDLKRATVSAQSKIEFLKLVRIKDERLRKTQELSNQDIEDFSRYITTYYPNVPSEIAKIISKKTKELTNKHDIDFNVIVGLMEVESSFIPFAKSKVDARGLLQIMFSVWAKTYNIKKISDLHGIEYNINIGIQILKHYLVKSKGNVTKALQKYNGSKGFNFSNKVFAAVGRFTIFRNSTINMKVEVNGGNTKK